MKEIKAKELVGETFSPAKQIVFNNHDGVKITKVKKVRDGEKDMICFDCLDDWLLKLFEDEKIVIE